MAEPSSARPTFAKIDLDALAFNFNSVRNFVGQGTKYMAVVKADAYGHGALPCAERLEAEGADWFGVATPEEGVELRNGGIRSPILCLGSFWPGQEDLIVHHSLTPVIYSLSAANRLNNFAKQVRKHVEIHVKIDTGMGRVGVRSEEVSEFAHSLVKFKNLRVGGLLTHFAAADDPSEDVFTQGQVEKFNLARQAFENAGHSPIWFDTSNSPGAVRGFNANGNLVRIGGALYGLINDILRPETASPELKPVLSLHSRIAAIKNVPAGESIGYGRTFITKRNSVIALVPIGYADGYRRGLSNVGYVAVKGEPAPIVGRISMDWTLIDVSDLSGVAEGDEVLLIGGGIKASDLAAELGTIAYEITCGISKRVPRIYR